MNPFIALFAKSPFKPLQDHMTTVKRCVDRLPALLAAVLAGDGGKRDELVKDICRLESDADRIKKDIRDHLPNSMFLPIDRRDVLDILTHQDAIADSAQDVAVTLCTKKLSLDPELADRARRLVDEVVKVCSHLFEVVQEIDELLETTFGGPERKKVLELIAKVETDETIADDLGIAVARDLFARDDRMSPVDVMLWFQIFRRIGDIANSAESTCNRLRILLAR